MNFEKESILCFLISILCVANSIGCMNAVGKEKNAADEGNITIRGNLKNLPDGKMYLLSERNKLLDSVQTKDGVFCFSLSSVKYHEPILLQIQHLDLNNYRRFFSFNTNILFKGKPWSTSVFMLEDSIDIAGTLKEFVPQDYKLYDNVKLTSMDKPILTGRQTRVMYNVSHDFSKKVDDAVLRETDSLIRKYPYSYYLLFGLRDWMGNFSDSQLNNLLAKFDKDVQQSSTMQNIKERMNVRSTKGLGVQTMMVDKDNQQIKIIDEAAKINMVVLWASWCGPCRQEIKVLKKLHKQFTANKSFRMVSVSLDENRDKWITAMQQEAMPWEQLWMTLEQQPYQKEIFGFDGSIPLTLFVDNHGKVLDKYVGYEDNSLQTYIEFIEKHLSL